MTFYGTISHENEQSNLKLQRALIYLWGRGDERKLSSKNHSGYKSRLPFPHRVIYNHRVLWALDRHGAYKSNARWPFTSHLPLQRKTSRVCIISTLFHHLIRPAIIYSTMATFKNVLLIGVCQHTNLASTLATAFELTRLVGRRKPRCSGP
jgi:hypothetical protein